MLRHNEKKEESMLFAFHKEFLKLKMTVPRTFQAFVFQRMKKCTLCRLEVKVST